MFCAQKNSVSVLFILIGSAQPPKAEHFHRYLRVRGKDCKDPKPTDLEAFPSCFYEFSFYLNLSCVMLVKGQFVYPNINYAMKQYAKADALNQYDNDTQVKLTPNSEIALIKAYHDYHKSRPGVDEPDAVTISPYIYVEGAEFEMTEEFINPQLEELAQDCIT